MLLLKYISFYFDALLRSLNSSAGLMLCSLRAAASGKASNPSKIAVIQMGALGDAVITLPLLIGLRQKFSAAKITVYCIKSGNFLFGALAEKHGWQVQQIRSGKFGEKSREGILLPSLAGYDLILHIRGDWRCMLRYFLASRAAFLHALPKVSRVRFSPFYLAGLPALKSSPLHQYDLICKMASELEISLPEYPQLIPIESARQAISERLKSVRNEYAVIHCDAPWGPRQWSSDKFIELAARLNQKFNWSIVLIGAGQSAQIASSLKEREISCIDLSAVLDFQELAALLAGAKVVVGADSGPGHLAGAVGAGTISLFGPQEPELWSVKSKRAIALRGMAFCSPCWQTACPFMPNNCMSSISVQNVFDAVIKQVSRT